MVMKRLVWWPAIIITVLALAIRLPGIGQVMTADEARWMDRSTEFIRAIKHGNIRGTFSTTHPGVVPMWLIGGGIAAQEWRTGITFDQNTISHFRTAATLPVAIVTSLLIGLAVYLLRSVFSPGVAVVSGSLLAIDPYLAGLSRITHLDALLALFMLTVVLAWLSYVQAPSRRRLVLVGVLAGLAGATKLLPALWLAVAIGLFELTQLLPLSGRNFGIILRRNGLWLAIAALTIIAIWPALWQPQHFGNVYYTSGLYDAYRGDIRRLAIEDEVPTEDTTEAIQPLSFYPRTLVSRTTPFNLIITIGLVIALGILWWMTWRQHQPASNRLRSLTWLVVYGLGFVILITFVGKKSDRYALPGLLIFPLLTGYVLTAVWPLAWDRLRRQWNATVAFGAMAVVTLALLVQTIIWYPYYSAYASPLGAHLIPSAQRGWGEGLDAAADWLNQQPGTDQMMVASWYPSVFGTYFHGQTTSLSARDDARVAYVVLYKNMYGRSNEDDATGVLEEFRKRQPIYTVTIQGEPYAWIYDTIGVPYFPDNTGELTGDIEVGQTMTINQPNWNVVEIGLSNYSGRANTHDLILHIKESPTATRDIRTVTINASQVADSDWNRFIFDPIPDSQGKTYYISLTSPESVLGNAITVRYSKTDRKPGQMYWRRRALKPGETLQTFVQKGDIAYKLDTE